MKPTLGDPWSSPETRIQPLDCSCGLPRLESSGRIFPPCDSPRLPGTNPNEHESPISSEKDPDAPRSMEVCITFTPFNHLDLADSRAEVPTIHKNVQRTVVKTLQGLIFLVLPSATIIANPGATHDMSPTVRSLEFLSLIGATQDSTLATCCFNPIYGTVSSSNAYCERSTHQ